MRKCAYFPTTIHVIRVTGGFPGGCIFFFILSRSVVFIEGSVTS